MIGLIAKTIKHAPSAAAINKQLDFGTAVGLTRTAQQGQQAVLGALRGTFTLRGNWMQPSNRFGIRIKPAKKNDLRSEVRTNADWLLPHETGKPKTARGGRVAVPTENVRRNKRMIIPRGQRPRFLKGKTFVIETRRGPVIMQRVTRGRNKGLRALYGLESQVKIRRQSTFYEPIEKVVRRRGRQNILDGIAFALRTAK